MSATRKSGSGAKAGAAGTNGAKEGGAKAAAANGWGVNSEYGRLHDVLLI